MFRQVHHVMCFDDVIETVLLVGVRSTGRQGLPLSNMGKLLTEAEIDGDSTDPQDLLQLAMKSLQVVIKSLQVILRWSN